MYSGRGLGIAPVVAAGAAAGPAAPAVIAGAALAYGISRLASIIGGDNVAREKLTAFEANPTMDGAADLRNYLAWVQSDTPPAQTSHGVDPVLANIHSWLGSTIEDLDSWISSHQMDYSLPAPEAEIVGPDDPAEIISVTVEEPILEPEVIPAGEAIPPINGTQTGSGTNFFPFIVPIGGAITTAAITAGGSTATGGGGGTTTQPAQSGSNPWLNPSSYGFLYRLLPKVGGEDQPAADPGGCECGPNYLGWIAAIAAAYWATNRKRGARRRRKAA